MASGSSGKRRCRILLAVTGSVAAVKLPEIVNGLGKFGAADEEMEIRIIATESARHFFRPASVIPYTLYTDHHEWKMWTKMGDPVLHVELRKWADMLVIAPLDANTIAKIANGICDNLLTCLVRAWDSENKPLLFAPAMNTFMFEHPITEQQIAFLTSLGYKEIPCVKKTLACGDYGKGAMAEVSTILDTIREVMTKIMKSFESKKKKDEKVHPLVVTPPSDDVLFGDDNTYQAPSYSAGLSSYSSAGASARLQPGQTMPYSSSERNKRKHTKMHQQVSSTPATQPAALTPAEKYAQQVSAMLNNKPLFPTQPLASTTTAAAVLTTQQQPLFSQQPPPVAAGVMTSTTSATMLARQPPPGAGPATATSTASAMVNNQPLFPPAAPSVGQPVAVTSLATASRSSSMPLVVPPPTASAATTSLSMPNMSVPPPQIAPPPTTQFSVPPPSLPFASLPAAAPSVPPSSVPTSMPAPVAATMSGPPPSLLNMPPLNKAVPPPSLLLPPSIASGASAPSASSSLTVSSAGSTSISSGIQLQQHQKLPLPVSVTPSVPHSVPVSVPPSVQAVVAKLGGVLPTSVASLPQQRQSLQEKEADLQMKASNIAGRLLALSGGMSRPPPPVIVAPAGAGLLSSGPDPQPPSDNINQEFKQLFMKNLSPPNLNPMNLRPMNPASMNIGNNQNNADNQMNMNGARPSGPNMAVPKNNMVQNMPNMNNTNLNNMNNMRPTLPNMDNPNDVQNVNSMVTGMQNANNMNMMPNMGNMNRMTNVNNMNRMPNRSNMEGNNMNNFGKNVGGNMNMPSDGDGSGGNINNIQNGRNVGGGMNRMPNRSNMEGNNMNNFGKNVGGNMSLTPDGDSGSGNMNSMQIRRNIGGGMNRMGNMGPNMQNNRNMTDTSMADVNMSCMIPEGMHGGSGGDQPLNDAVDAVVSGRMSTRAASSLYKVDRTILQTRAQEAIAQQAGGGAGGGVGGGGGGLLGARPMGASGGPRFQGGKKVNRFSVEASSGMDESVGGKKARMDAGLDKTPTPLMDLNFTDKR